MNNQSIRRNTAQGPHPSDRTSNFQGSSSETSPSERISYVECHSVSDNSQSTPTATMSFLMSVSGLYLFPFCFMSADVMFGWIPQNGGNAEQFIHTDTNESSEITTAAGHQQRGSLIFKYLRPCVSEVLRQWQSALRSVARVQTGNFTCGREPIKYINYRNIHANSFKAS